MNNSTKVIMNLNHTEKMPQIPASTSIGCCFALAIIYVASLYFWKNKQSRDHPATVKRRFLSVFIVMLISPVFLYKFSAPELLKHHSLWQLLGLRMEGLWAAALIPTLLTILLFLGPVCEEALNGTILGIFSDESWTLAIQNVLWIRNHIMGPLSEEFVFRACMMPLVLQSFSPLAATFITPLVFGVAHVHHIFEKLSMGYEWKQALLISGFQVFFTTLFGFYSAFLFARTGHLVAPLIAHAFCNHMGFPDIQNLWQYHLGKRISIITCYIIGLVGWTLLLPIATQPSLYHNNIFWNT